MAENLHSLLHSGMAANTIVMVSAEDLRAFTERLVTETRRAIEEQYQPRYYDSKQIMKLFGISRATLRNWIIEGKLPEPYIPEGMDKKLWDQAEIRDWVSKGRTGRYTHK